MYDTDQDGFISNGELFHTLKLMVGSNLKDAELQQIVDKSIQAGDKDGDGKLSFQEFCAVRRPQSLLFYMAFTRLLTTLECYTLMSAHRS